jgi:ferredoxin-type protein NapH
MYGLADPSLPILILWRLDPLLSISAALSGSEVPSGLLLIAAAMLLLAAAVGRAFCGWVCPLGFLQDLIGLGRKGIRLREDFRYVKYAILVGGLAMAPLARWTLLQWFTPLSMLPRGIAPIWGSREGIIVGVSVLAGALLFSALTERRAWCRYVCPLGALLSLPSARKAVGIRIDREKCTSCMRCQRKCTMGIIDIKGQTGLRWDSECIACLTCRDVCPRDAIGLAVRS